MLYAYVQLQQKQNLDVLLYTNRIKIRTLAHNLKWIIYNT